MIALVRDRTGAVSDAEVRERLVELIADLSARAIGLFASLEDCPSPEPQSPLVAREE